MDFNEKKSITSESKISEEPEKNSKSTSGSSKTVLQKKKKENESEIEFNWVQLKQEMDKIRMGEESRKEKLLRKIQENPLVPFGCFLTTAALCFGLYSFRLGNKRMSQIMMRSRIMAQGFTVFVMVVGVGYAANKKADIDKLLSKDNNDKKE